MYTITFTATFPERLATYIRDTLRKPGMSWRNVPVTNDMTIWQSMAFRRFANHRDSYYIGGCYGEKDTLTFQKVSENAVEISMSSTIPAAESDLIWLLGNMLEQCAFTYEIGMGEE